MGFDMRPLGHWQAGTAAEKELLRQCKEAARQLAADAELVLYGSRARGDAETESDYDLLVLLETPASEDVERRISSAIYRIERDAGIVISVQIYHRKEWDTRRRRSTPLHQNIDRDGVVV
jgi:predicted nucleotidyltransferase